jgi:hypothetical protein
MLQDSIAQARSGKIRSFNLVQGLLAACMRLASQPHAESLFSRYRSGATRIPDEDRVLIYNELEKLSLLYQQCCALTKLTASSSPKQVAALQLSVASSVWIHDRVREAFLWRTLLWEKPEAVPPTMHWSDSSRHFPACSGLARIDRGGMLSKPVLDWMEEVYVARVARPATANEQCVSQADSSSPVRPLF